MVTRAAATHAREIRDIESRHEEAQARARSRLEPRSSGQDERSVSRGRSGNESDGPRFRSGSVYSTRPRSTSVRGSDVHPKIDAGQGSEQKPREPPNPDKPSCEIGFSSAEIAESDHDARQVLEEIVTMGRPRARNMITGAYDDVQAYTKFKPPKALPKTTGGSDGDGGGGDGDSSDDGDSGISNRSSGSHGHGNGTATTKIKPKTDVKVIFFRYDKGKVVRCNKVTIALKELGNNDRLRYDASYYYNRSKPWLFRRLSKIRFLYFIRVEYHRNWEDRDIIKASYTDVLPFEGNRTVSRFIYLLHHSPLFDRSLIWGLQKLRHDMNETWSIPYIYIEIVEGLSSRAILSVGFTAVMFSLICGVAYAVPTDAWGDAFTLSGLFVACFALLLAVVAIYQYLGFERLIDDEIAAHSGHYHRYHPGQLGLGDISV